MACAVNTESGIQDMRDLLEFLWPAGHSFAGQDRSTGGRRAQRRMTPTTMPGDGRKRRMTPTTTLGDGRNGG
jgi:hypothetical protein